jgi:hypothetical protein
MGDVPIIDGGDGYYQIATPNNLYWMMATMTNVTVPNISNNFKLTANIDMATTANIATYNPGTNLLQSICSTIVLTEGPFIGIFDGQKGAPSPYIITIPLSFITTNSYFGLFGFVGNNSAAASIINLNIVYTGSTFSYTASTNPSYLGSLVGFCNKATVNNCNITYSNNVVITHTNTTGVQHTGGICGRIQNSSTLINSIVTFNGTASILDNCTPSSNSERNIGGICGYIGALNVNDISTFENCSLKLSSNTKIGSDTNTRCVGGICAIAQGRLIVNNCNIVQTPGASGGTFILQNSNVIRSQFVRMGILFGELNQYSITDDEIKNCSFDLSNFDLSIIGKTSGASPFNIGCLIGCALTGTTAATLKINNINATIKSILIDALNSGSTGNINIAGGIFGDITGPLNINTCLLTCLNNYTIMLMPGQSPNAGLSLCYYGGIAGQANLATVGNLFIPSNTSYRFIENCDINVGGNTLITINQSSGGLAGSQVGIISAGGLFGQISGGIRTGLPAVPTIPLIINECNGTFNQNVDISYTFTGVPRSAALNSIYMGGIAALSSGCDISGCNIIMGSNNNTILISNNTKNHLNSFMSCGFGQITDLTGGSIPVSTTVYNCNSIINGNMTMQNIPTTNTGMLSWNGGLVGRINNGSSCLNSSLTIIGALNSIATSTGSSATIGGLVGELLGTSVTLRSTLLSCTGTVSGNTILNANENVNFQAQIGGIVGIVNSFGRLESTEMIYQGTTTLKSTTAGIGARFIGGIVGQSNSAILSASKIIKNVIITCNNDIQIISNSSSSTSSGADAILGGLFGKLGDSTACEGCQGIFNSKLTITNSGILASPNGSTKLIGGICAQVINVGAASVTPATITTSSIYVGSITELIVDISANTNFTRCGILFGLVQDPAINYGANASLCTGTFNDKVILNVNNTSSGRVIMGGVVGYNVRAMVNSNILNLNGLEIDNKSNTNSSCYAGIIAGNSESALLNNTGQITNCIVNITGNALLDTNSTTGESVVGILGGLIAAQFENNVINGGMCNFILNSSSSADGVFAGGLIGSITNLQVPQTFSITNNILMANTLIINTSSTLNSYVAGMIGRINTTGITINNNLVSVTNNTTLNDLNITSTIYMALLFAGLGGPGITGGPNIITNNTFISYQSIRLVANNSSPTIYISDQVAKNDEIVKSTVTNCNAYVCNMWENYLLNFLSYPVADAEGLTIYGSNYPITSTYISPNKLYKIDILPAITINITCLPRILTEQITCCTANICNKNPQSANYSNQVIVNRKAGQAMIADVDNQNANKITNTSRINVKPIFSSYQQYMTYLQSKNAR